MRDETAPQTGPQPAPTDTQAQDSTCPACGGAVRLAHVSTAFWEGDQLSVVRDVPALVCRACHKQYFADETVMRLDLIRAGGFASARQVSKMTVPVFSYPAARGDTT